ncbi:MAG: hypothetical protein KDA93_19750 [Planctomycetaceae bacterium]|nr:hypothetical protein [Planctomycetaceae bacterium]
MNSKFEELETRLDHLTTRRERLADHLGAVAERLARFGERPPNRLLDDLTSFRLEFCSVASDLGLVETEDGESNGAGDLSLDDLRRRLDWSRRVETALRVLGQVLKLRSSDGSTPEDLHAVFDDARIISQRLSSWPDVDPQVVNELSAGTHPLAQLVRLVGAGDDLSDQQWHEITENLCGAYGREVSVIAARGRLIFESEPSSM